MRKTLLAVATLSLLAMTMAPSAQAGALYDRWSSAGDFDVAIDWDSDYEVNTAALVSDGADFNSNICNQSNPSPYGGLVGTAGQAAVDTFNPVCAAAMVVAGIVIAAALGTAGTVLAAADVLVNLAIDYGMVVAELALDLAMAVVGIVLQALDPVVQFVDGLVATTCTLLVGDPNCGL